MLEEHIHASEGKLFTKFNAIVQNMKEYYKFK
jgi:hypothetical protein